MSAREHIQCRRRPDHARGRALESSAGWNSSGLAEGSDGAVSGHRGTSAGLEPAYLNSASKYASPSPKPMTATIARPRAPANGINLVGLISRKYASSDLSYMTEECDNYSNVNRAQGMAAITRIPVRRSPEVRRSRTGVAPLTDN
jgi:hypothetical protein